VQHLYQDPSLRAKLFQLLESEIAPKIDKRVGRPGMTLWSIFVCGVIRLDLNIDYDRLQELVNQHITLRQMLGHGLFDPSSYHYQTLKDNVIHTGAAGQDQPDRRRCRSRTGKKGRRSPAWALRLLRG